MATYMITSCTNCYLACTHGFLAVGHQCGPYATHGQLDARDGVVLVAVEPRNKDGEVGGQLLLCLRRNGGETKRCTLSVHSVCVCSADTTSSSHHTTELTHDYIPCHMLRFL